MHWHGIQAYGISRGAGGSLRIVRVRRGKAVPVASGAPDAPAVRGALAAIDREVDALDAVLAVPWPLGKTVSRKLVSPFASRAKSARIWSGLLDLSLPFPVEDAELDIAPLPAGGGKAQAFAQVVRKADFALASESWEAAGLHPTHAVAVVGELRREAAGGELVVLDCDAALWLTASGEERAIRWAAGAGDADKERLLRSRLARPDGAAERVLTWAGDGAAAWAERAEAWNIAGRNRVHPAGEDLLAVAAARRAADDATAANPLRDHPALAARAARAKARGVAAVAVLAALVAAGGIAAARNARSASDALAGRVARTARALVGRAVPPGSERLMVSRSRDERNVLHAAAEEAASPGAEKTLADVLAAFGDGGEEIARLAASPGGFVAEGTGDAAAAAERLRADGWEVDLERGENGWKAEGVRHGG
jgi:hypothetical protein